MWGLFARNDYLGSITFETAMTILQLKILQQNKLQNKMLVPKFIFLILNATVIILDGKTILNHYILVPCGYNAGRNSAYYAVSLGSVQRHNANSDSYTNAPCVTIYT